MKVELTAQVLRLYIGRPCDILQDHSEFIGYSVRDEHAYLLKKDGFKIVPHLRHLQGITEEECRNIYSMHRSQPIDDNVSYKDYWWEHKDDFHIYRIDLYVGSPITWLYLLSRGFDLFGLIDAGLAKDVEQ